MTLRLMTDYDLQLDTVGYLQGFPGTVTVHYIALFVSYLQGFPGMTVVRVTNEMQGSAILPGERSWILTRSVLTRDDKLALSP